MATPNASRVGDGIEHTNAFLGAITGILVGVAIGLAIAVAGIATAASGGLLAVAFIAGLSMICAGAVGGFNFGELIGSLSSSKSGVIGEGARTVFIGAGLPAAARARDALACGDPPITPGMTMVSALLGPLGMAGLAIYSMKRSEHGGAVIATGSETVFIGGHNAARIEDETTCSGKIIEGARTVGIGGGKTDVIDRRSWRPEIPQEMRDRIAIVDRVGIVLGLVSGYGAVRLLGTRLARIDFMLAVGDAALFGAEWAARNTFGEDSSITKSITWTRNVYDAGTLARSGRNNFRAGAPSVPSAPRVTTPDAPSVPRASAPDVPATPPRPVPQGGQTIPERVGQGGSPPPYAQANPNNYYYDPVAGRYKRR